MLEIRPGRKSSTRVVTLADGKLQSSDLFRDGRELTIIHNGDEYKLRLTGNGKLILTK
ncbi:MAG: hemin uptake protein HemP [Alphaproteobacteria bacterium]|nr:MAG: hemin uptake protein HemP [Alphaproteobacteria bacterium]